MPTALLTRVVTFSAAHRYHRPDWSDQRNRQVFGACNNPVGHGHNYRLAATVEGDIDAETGFSTDLAALDAVLHGVIAPLDHQHLNHALPEFGEGRLIPTSENILMYLWPRIAAAVPFGSRLRHLRLYEDETLYVDYAAENGVA
jgi:6-pyruvoyltetrahydropterin/6-carboxytetrahydropterin synthase